MTKLHWVLSSLLSLSTPLFASAEDLQEDKADRLQALMELNLEELGEVEVKLDDVFDVFNGLVKPNSVKIASGIKQSTATAPASTTVITAQDIEAMGTSHLEDILEAVPGIHISLSEISFAPLYDIRGIHSASNYEVLVMINGIPVKNVVNGTNRAWTTLAVQNIDRIEVIRGPGSALYGADAVSGVINIITKTAEDIHGTEAGIRVDSHQTYNPWLLYGGTVNGFEVTLGLDYLDTEGHQEPVFQDVQSLLDKANGTAVSQAPSRTYLQKQQLSLYGAISKGHWQLGWNWLRGRNLGAGLGSTMVISPEEHREMDNYTVDLGYHNPTFMQHWETHLQLGYQELIDEMFNSYTARPGAIRNGQLLPYGAPNNTGAKQRQARLDLGATYYGFGNHTMRFGSGYWYADLCSVPWFYLLDPTVPVMVDARVLGLMVIPENVRQNYYFFTQDSWALLPNWELTMGVRYDGYSDFDSTTNPRVALVWTVNPQWTGKLLYGTAFRAPSFVEMYTPPGNRVVVGNPNLKAEQNTTWELGVDYHLSDSLNLTLNLFNYVVTDKIQRRLMVQDIGTIYTYDNLGKLTGRGLELEGRWKINNKSSLLANYAYAQVETGEELEAGNYPHHQIYLRHDWLLGNNWFLDTQLNWIADRDRPANDRRPPLENYMEWDMTFRYKNTSRNAPWNFAIGVRNLLDEDRREPGDPRLLGDYPKAGREWFGEIRYRF